MNWLSILIGLLQIILGRIQPKTVSSQHATALADYERAQCYAIAEQIAAMKPGGQELSRNQVEALAAGLPGFIDDLIGMLPKDFLNKSIGCAFAALLAYFQTKDIGSALTGFISCTIGGIVTPPPGGTDPPTNPPGTPPGGGGGIDPTKPTLQNVKRCS